jgi:dephospho-CoA kinase
MVVIGLTGGILSGKSTISGMLAEKGAIIIDADQIGHEAYKPHTKTWQELVNTFGDSILKQNNEVDRKKLGDIVFADTQALERLNEIVHPRIRAMVQKELDHLEGDGIAVVILEAALLIEADWKDLVDTVWVTVAPEDVVLKRLRERGGLSEDQARARIGSQISSEERSKHADEIINTDCQLSEVGDRVEELWKKLLNRK